MITLYSKPNCPHCEGAERWLTERAFEFTKIDVTQDPAALAKVKGDGHTTVPQIYHHGKLLVAGGFAGLRELGADKLRERLAA